MWIKDCAKKHELCVDTIFGWIRRRHIHAYKYPLDRHTYVDDEEVQAYLPQKGKRPAGLPSSKWATRHGYKRSDPFNSRDVKESGGGLAGTSPSKAGNS